MFGRAAAGNSTTSQSTEAIAVGQLRVMIIQNSVAIGKQAGQVNQAANSIVLNAIGTTQNATTAKSIVINADSTGGAISAANEGLFIAPLRTDNNKISIL